LATTTTTTTTTTTMGGGGGVILTITTFWDFVIPVPGRPSKWEEFECAIRSLLHHHPDLIPTIVDRILVVNEWAPGAAAAEVDRRAAAAALCPGLEVYQKTEAERGQPRSLNIIREAVAPYDLWVHWEESWELRAPALGAALAAMRRLPNLHQLQLSDGFKESVLFAPTARVPLDDDATNTIVYLPPPPFWEQSVSMLLDGTWQERRERRERHGHGVRFWCWPLFSLHPAINRVSFFRCLPPFCETAGRPAPRFECMYGVEFLRHGGTKAVLEHAVAGYQASRTSTWYRRQWRAEQAS
jgi:hypothetical protein